MCKLWFPNNSLWIILKTEKIGTRYKNIYIKPYHVFMQKVVCGVSKLLDISLAYYIVPWQLFLSVTFIEREYLSYFQLKNPEIPERELSSKICINYTNWKLKTFHAGQVVELVLNCCTRLFWNYFHSLDQKEVILLCTWVNIILETGLAFHLETNPFNGTQKSFSLIYFLFRTKL